MLIIVNGQKWNAVLPASVKPGYYGMAHFHKVNPESDEVEGFTCKWEGVPEHMERARARKCIVNFLKEE